MTELSLEAVERALSASLEARREPCEGTLLRAEAHSLLNGGKRLRAKLVLLFCELYGGEAEAALPLACAMEMIHAHSLIHDDLPCMDNAATRRGKPSCHVAFDEATALLAGDALSALAFETVAEAKSLTDTQKAKATALLASRTRAMLVGQTMDKAFENRTVSVSELTALQEHKTGALLCAACELGALAAGADGAVAREYGDALGRAFQITDDILDVTSTAEEMGKPVKNDADKNTFVSLLGREEAFRLAEEQTRRAVDAVKPFGAKADKLIALAESLLTRTH